MPEEIPHMTYLSNKDYKTAVGNHIGRILSINKKAKEKNQESARKFYRFSKEKFVKKASIHNFVVGDIVLINIKKRIKDIKNVGVRWIGPSTVVYENPSKLFDIEYDCKGKTTKYLRVRPEFFLYLGQVV